MNRHLIIINGEEAEMDDSIEFCGERLWGFSRGMEPCINRAKATVDFADGRVRRVCGIHARANERRLETVTWDEGHG